MFECIETKCLKLEENPACIQYSPEHSLIVSTYQLEGEDSRIGSFLVLNSDLQIEYAVKPSGGIFRFNFARRNPSLIYAALTTGRVGLVDLKSRRLSETQTVSEGMLLDLDDRNGKFVVSDDRGNLSLVDEESFRTTSTWNAHCLPCTSDSKCEVWSCAWLDANTCASGADDSLLKVWDTRVELKRPAMVNRSHAGGVVFLERREDFNLITGSYDEHVRIFDMRNLSTVLISTKVWKGRCFIP